MANQKLTDRAEKATISADALIHIVEPNDLSQSPEGSSYKFKASNLPDATQDNIDIVKRIKIASTETISEILVKINNLPTYIVNEVKSVWVVARSTPSLPNQPYVPQRVVKFKVVNVGKGTYGNGGVQLTTNNIELISDNIESVLDIESDPTTDIINYGALTGQTVSQWLNLKNPAIAIQPQTDGYTLFKGSVDGDDITYLWIGDAGVYGVGETMSTMADFQEVSEELPEPVEPDNYLKLTGETSQSVDGIVNFESATVTTDPTSGIDIVNKTYADGLVVGLFKLANTPEFDASGGTYPLAGTGTGTAGAILKGDSYIVSVAGTINGQLYEVGDTFFAKVNSPAQDPTKWGRFEVPTGLATALQAGIMKLYTSTGSSTDGTMDRNSITTAINAKVADVITDGVTSVAPSQNAVFDALLTKMTLRGNVGSSINLDTLIVPGYYHTSLTTTNTPPGLSISVSLLIVMKSLATTGTTIIQHFYEAGTSRHAVRSSADTGTTWSAWAISQEALVSGTTIKTIEGQSLLGSGNIDLVKADVGLSNVDNTSDVNKPVSTAQAAANALKANLAGGNTFTGNQDITGSVFMRDGAGGVVARMERGTGGVLFVMGTNIDDLYLNNKANTIRYQSWFSTGNTTIKGTVDAGFTHDVQGTGRYTVQLTTPIISLTGTASPVYGAGRLFYDTTNESLTFFNNDSNVGLQVGQETWIRVRNDTGSTINNGSAVYISGTHASGLPNVTLAQANAAATTIVSGLATENIPNNSIGYVTCIGIVHNIDTSSFTAGATVFLSSTVAGGLTTTAPLSPNYRYRVGIVTKVNPSTGTIHVTPSTAALGNGTANQVFGINNAGTAQEVKSIVGTANQVSVTHTANTVTVGLNLLTASAALDFPSAAAGTNSDLTIALAGAVLGDVVTLGVPNAAVLAGTCFTAFVSAANVVTVRHNNYSSTAKDPVSGTFKVTILRP